MAFIRLAPELFVLLISFILLISFPASSFLICKHKELIRVHIPAFVPICSIKNNLKINNISFTKSKSCLSDQLSVPPQIVQNSTSYFSLLFHNVSWNDGGLYKFRIKLSDGKVLKRDFNLGVGDIPGLPLQDEEPTPCNEKDGSFCFGFKLPKQHPCSRHTTTQYWLRYPSSCKRLKQPKPLSCSIGNNEGTVRCKDQFLDYCSNSTLKDCWDDLRLQGQNKLGFSKILYFNLNPGITVPQSSLTIGEMEFTSLSPRSLEVSWTRPSCREFDYIYKLSYASTEANVSLSKLYDLPDSDKRKWRKGILNRLKPFTNYTICLFSMRSYGDIYYTRGPCQDYITPQAVPERAPVITASSSHNTGNGKWKCNVHWKGIERRYYNGIINYTVLKIFDKLSASKLARPEVLVPIHSSSYEIKNLDVGFDYFLQLQVCTSAGCKSSELRDISIEHTGNHEKTASYSLITIGVVVGVILLVFFVALAWVFISQRRRRRSGMKKSTSTSSLLTVSDVIQPRDAVDSAYNEIEQKRTAYNVLPPANLAGSMNDNEIDDVADSFNVTDAPRIDASNVFNASSSSNCMSYNDSNFENPLCVGSRNYPIWENNGDFESGGTSCDGNRISFLLETDPLMPSHSNSS